MIPKIIHYCWFGGGELPELALKCIESWKKFLPDYEIKEWNESNFNLDLYPYAREAYDNRKFAFVTDIVRLYALYHEGGIYMDTDVEVLKNLDNYLIHNAFSGFESDGYILTGIIASVAHNHWLKLQLDYYDGRHFLFKNGSLDLTTNVEIITKITKAHYKIELNNSYQDIGDIVFYPSDFFCPKNHATGIISFTKNTACIHHFAGSWTIPLRKKYTHMRRILSCKIGIKLANIILLPLQCVCIIKEIGVKSFLRKVCIKMGIKERK